MNAPGASLHMNSVTDYFIRTLCASLREPYAFKFLWMVLGENILQALFLKGISNVPQGEKKKKKNYSTFELQGVTGEILLSKTVKMEWSLQFQGKISVGHNQG